MFMMVLGILICFKKAYIKKICDMPVTTMKEINFSKINVSKFLDVGNKISGNIYLIKITRAIISEYSPHKNLVNENAPFFKIGPIKFELSDNFSQEQIIIIDYFIHSCFNQSYSVTQQ
jgi:hypothetical protein